MILLTNEYLDTGPIDRVLFDRLTLYNQHHRLREEDCHKVLLGNLCRSHTSQNTSSMLPKRSIRHRQTYMASFRSTLHLLWRMVKQSLSTYTCRKEHVLKNVIDMLELTYRQPPFCPGLHDLHIACLNTYYNMKAISLHYNITDQLSD